MKAFGFRAGLMILMFAFFAGAAQAQSLGAIARKLRQERAEQQQKPAKVYTNDNIPHAPSIAASSSGSTAASTSSGAQGSAKSLNPAIALAQKAAQTGNQQAAASNNAEHGSTTKAPESPMKTKQYWQEQFKNARAALALAKEHQQLDANELDLLKLQSVRELNPNTKANLDNQIASKQSDLAARKAETEKAQKALANLEKKFKESGAPSDWIEKE